MTGRALLNKRDIGILGGVLITAAVLYAAWYFGHRADTVYGRITVDGLAVKTVDLSADGTFSLPQRPNILFNVQNGAAAFIASDCPDQICVNSGYLSHPGQTAVCLPNRTSLAIVGTGGQDEADLVAE